MSNRIIEVQNIKVNINDNDYICISDFTKFKDGKSTSDDIIRNWLRNRITLEFLGTWESIYNPNFNSVEFDGFRKESGLHTFTLSVTEWCNKTNAIGMYSKRGKYGGTYAHKDIAFEFASWVSPEFKLYIIQDYQRLKSEKSHQDTLDWNVKRLLSKANYRIHTDAIKQNLIPPDVSKINQSRIYANEADLLNVALFGKTASEWRNENPDKKNENIRNYATIEQLLVLSNLESLNALLIEKGVSQDERLKQLNSTAIQQLKSLTNNKSVHKLDKLNNETKSLPKK